MTDVRELFSLHGRIAIVTGAAGLYGRHVADALASVGATVVLASRDLAACEQAADELHGRGLSAWAHELDLGSEASITSLRDAVIARYGRIDVLVNNAVTRGGGDLFETAADAWDSTARVNGRGLFLITQACAEPMVRAGSGSIVNVGSIYGVVGPDFSIYGETGMTTPITYAFDKGGMIALTRYLATRLGPFGVRVNCISPGGLQTDQADEFVAGYIERTPLRRMAGPDDIKGPIAFLASDASRYVTGVNLLVDGGWTAQ